MPVWVSLSWSELFCWLLVQALKKNSTYQLKNKKTVRVLAYYSWGSVLRLTGWHKPPLSFYLVRDDCILLADAWMLWRSITLVGHSFLGLICVPNSFLGYSIQVVSLCQHMVGFPDSDASASGFVPMFIKTGFRHLPTPEGCTLVFLLLPRSIRWFQLHLSFSNLSAHSTFRSRFKISSCSPSAGAKCVSRFSEPNYLYTVFRR